MRAITFIAGIILGIVMGVAMDNVLGVAPSDAVLGAEFYKAESEFYKGLNDHCNKLVEDYQTDFHSKPTKEHSCETYVQPDGSGFTTQCW